MGNFLEKPLTNKTHSAGQGNGLRYGFSSMQGWRLEMEDAHILETSMSDTEPFKDWSFFAVFDGHSGKATADDAATHLLKTLMDTEQFQKITEMLKTSEGVLTPTCLQLLEEGIKCGFLLLDENLRTKNNVKNKSGCTAISAIITPTHIIIANLGDSRAVLVRKEGPPLGTEDHKPYNEKERKRIEKAGGYVMIQRINGTLAVSRALGDYDFKSVEGLEASLQLVSPEPDVYVIERDYKQDEFLLLACDGIYDVMNNAELATFVRARFSVEPDLAEVCDSLLDHCLMKESRDNMTAIVLAFDEAPKIDQEKVSLEEDWVKAVTSNIDKVLDVETSDPQYVPGQSTLCVEHILKKFLDLPSLPSIETLPDFRVKEIIAKVMNRRNVKSL